MTISETLERAREIREAGEPAVEAQLARFSDLDREIKELSAEVSWFEDKA